MKVSVQHYVFWFEVTVHDSVRVELFQGQKDLRHIDCCQFFIQSSFFIQEFAKISIRTVLEHIEQVHLVLEGIKELDDVGMRLKLI